MEKAPLRSTNIYLRDPIRREQMLRKTIISSCAIKGCGKAAARALAGDKPQPKTMPKPSAAVESA